MRFELHSDTSDIQQSSHLKKRGIKRFQQGAFDPKRGPKINLRLFTVREEASNMEDKVNMHTTVPTISKCRYIVKNKASSSTVHHSRVKTHMDSHVTGMQM